MPFYAVYHQEYTKQPLINDPWVLCREEEAAPNGQLSFLPLDILQKVASLMSLKDWARAAGACRLMHSLQLDVITVADPSVQRINPIEQEQSTGAHQGHAFDAKVCERNPMHGLYAALAMHTLMSCV